MAGRAAVQDGMSSNSDDEQAHASDGAAEVAVRMAAAAAYAGRIQGARAQLAPQVPKLQPSNLPLQTPSAMPFAKRPA